MKKFKKGTFRLLHSTVWEDFHGSKVTADELLVFLYLEAGPAGPARVCARGLAIQGAGKGHRRRPFPNAVQAVKNEGMGDSPLANSISQQVYLFILSSDVFKKHTGLIYLFYGFYGSGRSRPKMRFISSLTCPATDSISRVESNTRNLPGSLRARLK